MGIGREDKHPETVRKDGESVSLCVFICVCVLVPLELGLETLCSRFPPPARRRGEAEGLRPPRARQAVHH
eukprot:3621222-Pyramimonas_sp.AAC.1